MKALEQARPNLPQKPAKSTKPGGKSETFNAVDDDGEVAAGTSSKPTSAAGKVASKAGKPNSATASAAGKKV